MKHTEFLTAFAAALFEQGDEPHAPLVALTSQPAFAVYRNTVMKGCIDTLEANFPSITRLVGREWFRAAAALHVAEHPPTDGRLLRYGDEFVGFLQNFEPAREMPYLAGVARLDRFWTEVHVAADAQAVNGADLSALAPERLGEAVLTPHPAARWQWFGDQPIYSIWLRNSSPLATPAEYDDSEIAWHGEGALLTRRADAVVSQPASEAACAFLDACASGAPLGEAAAAAMAIQPGVDLADMLATLLRADALTLACEPLEPSSSPPFSSL